MKKLFKRFASVITAALLCTAVIIPSAAPANADYSSYVPFETTIPEGYETFDYGYLHETDQSEWLGEINSIAKDVSYRHNEYVSKIIIPYKIVTHGISIRIDPYKDEETSAAVYDVVEKYRSEFPDLEIADYTGRSVSISNYTDCNTDAGIPETMENKCRIALEMCREITEAGGVITKASYYPYTVAHCVLAFRGIYVYGFPGTEEEFTAYAKSISDELEITTTPIRGEYVDDVAEGTNHFRAEIVIEPVVDEFTKDEAAVVEAYKLWEAIAADYPECIVRSYDCPADDSGSETVTTGSSTTDILAAIQEEASCDINKNGTPDLDDAVLVLTSYANTAAGIETAADTVSCDVNGDGAVDLDDAVKVLTVYAELAAGLR